MASSNSVNELVLSDDGVFCPGFGAGAGDGSKDGRGSINLLHPFPAMQFL